MRRPLPTIAVLILSSVLISLVSARAQTNTLRYRDYSISHQILPQGESGYKITFQYKNESDTTTRTLESVQLVVFENPYQSPETLPMTRTGDSWETVWDFSQKDIAMILYGFETVFKIGEDEVSREENNQGEWWSLLLKGKNGRPVQGAYQALALLQAGAGDILDEDLHLAVKTIEKEIELYPENLEARTIRIQLLLKESGDDPAITDQIEQEVDRFVESSPDNMDVMNYAVNAYRLIGKDEKASKTEEELVQTFPESTEAVKKAFEDIMGLESDEEKTARLKTFCQKYPDSPYIEYALSTLASLLITQKDNDGMIRVGDQLLKKASTPAAAGGLAGLAGAFAENGIELKRAVAYAEKAVELIQNTGPSEKPSGISDEDWQDQIQKTEARYLDVLGWAYVRSGDLKNGLASLSKAAGMASLPGIYYHYAVALEKAGRLKEAAVYYARAVSFNDETAAKAMTALRALWQKTERDSTEMNQLLDEQQQWVIDRYDTGILSRRMNREAPDFNLEDVKGGWVSLSDQVGNVVLLCFWGTWSQSSYNMLRDLQNLAYDYGQDVLFLTIAVDPDPDKVREYVKKYKLALPTLLNDGTDRDYNLEGVPMLFVIDQTGTIQFEHRGYRPDLIEAVMVELDTLLNE